MGFYEKHIFSRLMDNAMRGFDEERRRVLAPAHGQVLEVGFGTGMNLRNYPDTVERLVALDPLDVLQERVEKRIAAVSFPVERVNLSADGTLPFADDTFDTVVATFTLCSIPDVEKALAEMKRVLKPGGHYLFLEHGKAESPRVARWQDRLNPVQNVIGCGCNLNREADRLVQSAGFDLDRFDRYVFESEEGGLLASMGAFMGTLYEGVARKP